MGIKLTPRYECKNRTQLNRVEETCKKSIRINGNSQELSDTKFTHFSYQKLNMAAEKAI